MNDIHLLHVDDSKIARHLMDKAVSVFTHFHGAETLAEARAMLAEREFGFLVLDYELPDGDGLELARELRDDPRYSRTPIVLYTASLDNELAFQAMRAGVNLSLSKPTDPMDLRGHIVRLIAVPEVHSVRRELVQLTCFGWHAGSRFHEYCPDLELHLQGDDAEAVRAAMQERIEKELLAKPDPESYPAEVKVFKHVVRLRSREQASGTDQASEAA